MADESMTPLLRDSTSAGGLLWGRRCSMKSKVAWIIAALMFAWVIWEQGLLPIALDR